jgi:hypothetical protein
MTVIDDLRTAVDNYETDSCKTEIVNFAIDTGGGGLLHVGETFTFKVKVMNEGQLDMNGVKVRAMGTANADVALSSGSFGSAAISGAFDLPAHSSHTTGQFRGKAKASTGGAKDIVSARIDTWDATLSHILKGHSNAGAAEAKLNKDIAAD